MTEPTRSSLFPNSLDRWCFLSGATLICIGFAFRLLQVWAYFVDDAFITMRHARNFVEGHGFVYNPGGPVVESFTNMSIFFWQVIVLWLGGDALLWTKVLGALGGFAVLAGSVLISRELLLQSGRESPPMTPLLVGPAWLASTYLLSTGATSGLETTFFAGLITLGAWGVLTQLREAPPAAPAGVAAAVLALAMWTRPEAILLGFLLCFPAWLLRIRNWRLFAIGATAASSWISLILFRLIVFNSLHPNTYYAKMGGDPVSRIMSGLSYLQEFLLNNGALIAILFALTAVTLLAGRARLAGAIVLLVGISHLALVTWQGGDWIPHLRFVVPVSGLLAGLASAGLALALQRLPARWLCPICLLLPLSFPALLDRENRRVASELQVRVFGWIDGHRALGKWIQAWENERMAAGHPPFTILIEDIGLVGWLTKSEIIDLAGLADPEWARYAYETKKQAPYPAAIKLEMHNPDIVVIVGVARPTETELFVVWDTNKAVLQEPIFRRRYRHRGLFVHKDFPSDGYFIHVFVRNDLYPTSPRIEAPIPRARSGWGDEGIPYYFSANQ
jgi:hypothetical protein